MTPLQRCRTCGRELPWTSEKFSTRAGKLTRQCRDCHREYERRYKQHLRNGTQSPAQRRNITRPAMALLVYKVVQAIKAEGD